MKHLESKINSNEFFTQYTKETQKEYFEQLHKDYLFKFQKKGYPILPQELEKFCRTIGFKIENPTKKDIVIFLLNKGIN